MGKLGKTKASAAKESRGFNAYLEVIVSAPGVGACVYNQQKQGDTQATVMKAESRQCAGTDEFLYTRGSDTPSEVLIPVLRSLIKTCVACKLSCHKVARRVRNHTCVQPQSSGTGKRLVKLP